MFMCYFAVKLYITTLIQFIFSIYHWFSHLMSLIEFETFHQSETSKHFYTTFEEVILLQSLSSERIENFLSWYSASPFSKMFAGGLFRVPDHARSCVESVHGNTELHQIYRITPPNTVINMQKTYFLTYILIRQVKIILSCFLWLTIV